MSRHLTFVKSTVSITVIANQLQALAARFGEPQNHHDTWQAYLHLNPELHWVLIPGDATDSYFDRSTGGHGEVAVPKGRISLYTASVLADTLINRAKADMDEAGGSGPVT